MGDYGGTLQIEYNDNSMKTNFILKRFSGTFRALRFNEKSVLNTLLGSTTYWDYMPTIEIHADSAGVYISENNINFKYNRKNPIEM